MFKFVLELSNAFEGYICRPRNAHCTTLVICVSVAVSIVHYYSFRNEVH